MEGVIDQLEASQHGVQVSVCVHSHRLKVKDQDLLPPLVKDFIFWVISPPFRSEGGKCVGNFLNHQISTSE